MSCPDICSSCCVISLKYVSTTPCLISSSSRWKACSARWSMNSYPWSSWIAPAASGGSESSCSRRLAATRSRILRADSSRTDSSRSSTIERGAIERGLVETLAEVQAFEHELEHSDAHRLGVRLTKLLPRAIDSG